MIFESTHLKSIEFSKILIIIFLFLIILFGLTILIRKFNNKLSKLKVSFNNFKSTIGFEENENFEFKSLNDITSYVTFNNRISLIQIIIAIIWIIYIIILILNLYFMTLIT